jgi:hypothetical protein
MFYGKCPRYWLRVFGKKGINYTIKKLPIISPNLG